MPRNASQTQPAPASPADTLTVELPTAAATSRLGAQLGRLLQPGDVLGLDGPLGAGKTCLVGGLARGLGVQGPVTSPTFTLVNQHAGRLTLYHVDLYRLNSAQEVDELGLWESAEAGGVMAVEWLSRFPDTLPPDRLQLELRLHPVRGRILTLTASGERSRQRLAELAKARRT